MLPSHELFDITTIVQYVEEIGRSAVKRLFELMENPQSRAEIQRIDTEMVVRKSCGKPKTVRWNSKA